MYIYKDDIFECHKSKCDSLRILTCLCHKINIDVKRVLFISEPVFHWFGSDKYSENGSSFDLAKAKDSISSSGSK